MYLVYGLSSFTVVLPFSLVKFKYTDEFALSGITKGSILPDFGVIGYSPNLIVELFRVIKVWYWFIKLLNPSPFWLILLCAFGPFLYDI